MPDLILVRPISRTDYARCTGGVSVLGWGYPPASSRLAMAATFARLFPAASSSAPSTEP